MPIQHSFVAGVSADSSDKIRNDCWPVRVCTRIDRTPIRKTFLASRSNRQRGGQASLTMYRLTRGRWMKGRNQTTQFRSAQNATASCHYVRSERSPLHDVRQHARRNSFFRKRPARICFLADEIFATFADRRLVCRAVARGNWPAFAYRLRRGSLRLAPRAKAAAPEPIG